MGLSFAILVGLLRDKRSLRPFTCPTDISVPHCVDDSLCLVVLALLQPGWCILPNPIGIFCPFRRKSCRGTTLLPWGGGVILYWVLRRLADKCRCIERPAKHDVVVMHLCPPCRSGRNFGLIFLLVLACFALTLVRITVKVMGPERGSKI